jgi:molybdopterin converting factor small subunit
VDYDERMPVRVEFFGIARQRAGVAVLEVPMAAPTGTLGEVLGGVVDRVPSLSDLVPGGLLHDSLQANLDGRSFVSDPATAIRDGQSLLILSADAGG